MDRNSRSHPQPVDELGSPLRSQAVVRQASVLCFGKSARAQTKLVCSADSINGRFILLRLADYLANLEKEQDSALQLKARIALVPDDNMVSLPQRRDLVSLQRQCAFRLTINDIDPALEQMPHVALYQPNDDERASACLFGLPAVIESDEVSLDDDENWFGERFSIQLGRPGNLDLAACQLGFQALLNFLLRQGLLQGSENGEDEDFHYFGPDQQHSMHATHAGLFVSRMSAGAWLQRGAEVGFIYSDSDGSLLHTVRAPVAGVLCNLRREAEVAVGEPLLSICSI